jgi:undecaprenyl-diphosphatase
MTGLISQPSSSDGTPLPVTVRDEGRPKHTRSPSDLLRLLVAATVALVGLALASGLDDIGAGVAIDTIDAFGNLPRPVVVSFILIVQLLAWVAPIAAAATVLWQRRYRRAALAALAATLGVGGAWLIDGLVIDRFSPPSVDLPVPSWICSGLERSLGIGAGTPGDIVDVATDPVGVIGELTSFACVQGDGFPTILYLAGFVAAFSALSPWLSKRWRRAAWVLIALFTVVRVIDGVTPPVDSLFVIAAAYGLGAATLLAAGGPDRRPRAPEVAAALRSSGLDVIEIEPAAARARSAIAYRATTEGGDAVFVKVFSPDERAAELMYRISRMARFKGTGDERPFSSLQRQVEHEAVISLKAASDGVRTPLLEAAVGVDGHSAALAYRFVDGRRLIDMPADDIDDGLLDSIWSQVRRLHDRQTAHRNLNLTNLMVDARRDVWITDFGFAELGADRSLLRADVAQLLVATALVVGPARSVAAAIGALGTEAVADAAPLLQPAALGSSTQAALRGQKGLLSDLADEVKDRTGVESITYQQLQRVRRKTVITAAMLGLAFYLLIPQLADVDLGRIADANWWWVVPAGIASVVTYVGAALAMMGGIPGRLRLVDTFLVQVASSFFNRITPAKVGGMAANIRFLQKAGIDSAVAVAGVGLSNIAGVVVHVLLLIMFMTRAGTSAPESIPLPSGQTVLIGLVIVLTVAGLIMLLPWGRRIFLKDLLPVVRKATAGVAVVGQNPRKIALLIGGSLVTTVAYIFALWYSLEAFGNGLDFVKVATVYLAGSAVAQAAPTPGGIGAAEAALIAGLTAFGMPSETAVPAVFLYRLVTFWLPVLPGYLGYRRLAAAGAL